MITRIPVLSGLGVACPAGSSTKYTGALNPAGGSCRCNPGWIWLNGYCQSPQSYGQQSGRSLLVQTQQNPNAQTYAAQPLTQKAKDFFAKLGYSINCKIVKGQAGPQGSVDMNMCSINGGPYEHSAYAVNLNPQTALNSAVPNTQSVINRILGAFNVAQEPSSGSDSGSGVFDNGSGDDAAEVPSDSGLDIFGSSITLFGYDVPVILLAGAAGLFLFTSKD